MNMIAAFLIINVIVLRVLVVLPEHGKAVCSCVETINELKEPFP